MYVCTTHYTGTGIQVFNKIIIYRTCTCTINRTFEGKIFTTWLHVYTVYI